MPIVLGLVTLRVHQVEEPKTATAVVVYEVQRPVGEVPSDGNFILANGHDRPDGSSRAPRLQTEARLGAHRHSETALPL